MDTRGAITVDLSGESPRDVVQPYVVKNIPALVPTAPPAFDDGFASLVFWYNVPQGAASIYVGDKFDWQGNPLPFPFQIDWRLFHGVGCPGQGAIFDMEPAVGSTMVKTAADLSRQGMLFQFGGLQADQYLLQARLRVASTNVTMLKATIYSRFQPGLQQAVPAISVGTVIG